MGKTGFDRLSILDDPPEKLIEKILALGVERLLVAGDAELNRVNHPWLGRTRIWGREADIARLLSPTIQAKLITLPRRLATVYIDDQAMVISWFGVESEGGVIQQAFEIGIDCLEALSPRN